MVRTDYSILTVSALKLPMTINTICLIVCWLYELVLTQTGDGHQLFAGTLTAGAHFWNTVLH